MQEVSAKKKKEEEKERNQTMSPTQKEQNSFLIFDSFLILGRRYTCKEDYCLTP